MITPKAEETIVKWLFGEIVSYHNNGKQKIYPGQRKWASRTRIQKIIFTTLEALDIPITRSWYLWGGYVHSKVLNESFDYYNARFANEPDSVIKLRKKVNELAISVGETQEILRKQADYVLATNSRSFLPKYYKEEAPEEYTDVYVSKQYLSDHYDYIKTDISTLTFDHYKEKLDHYTYYNYMFNDSALEVLYQEDLYDNLMRFNDLVGTIQDKILYELSKDNLSIQRKLSIYRSISKCYKKYIWMPFACKISQNTVTGIRSKEEYKEMVEREVNSIHYGKINIRDLSARSKKNKLDLTYREYKELNDKLDKNLDVKDEIDLLLSSYIKAKDEA